MPNSRRRRRAWRLTRVLAAPTLLAGLFAGLVPAVAIPGFAGAMTSCRSWTGTPLINPCQNPQPTSVFPELWAVRCC